MEVGLDPIFDRRKAQGIPTFREAGAKVIADNGKTWRNEKHAAQWSSTLEAYVFPHIGDRQVSEITGPMIRNLLSEIWLSKPETARRVRQRVGAVLDWAYASGFRETEAPMRAITKGLPRQPKKVGLFAAMPYYKVPAFLRRLPERETFSRLALQFAIFAAARSGGPSAEPTAGLRGHERGTGGVTAPWPRHLRRGFRSAPAAPVTPAAINGG